MRNKFRNAEQSTIYLIQVTGLTAKFGDAGKPGLAVVLVGARKDSAT